MVACLLTYALNDTSQQDSTWVRPVPAGRECESLQVKCREVELLWLVEMHRNIALKGRGDKGVGSLC